MRILWNNEFMNNIVSAASENPNYPASNLGDPRRSRYYRSTSNLAQRIKLAGSGIAANYIAIFNHNLSNGATVKLQANHTDEWTNPPYSLDITPVPGTIIKFFPLTVVDQPGELFGDNLFGNTLAGGPGGGIDCLSFNYWSLYVNDTLNTDGYLKIGLIYLSKYIQMPGVKEGASLPQNTASRLTVSGSGQAYGDLNYDFRNYEIDMITTQDQRKEINSMFSVVKNVKPIVLLVWEDDLGEEPAIYCVIENPGLEWKKSMSQYIPWAVSMKIREVF